MPIDLAQVDWLYVILLAVFVAVSTFLGSLLSFRRHGTAAVLSAVLFAVIFMVEMTPISQGSCKSTLKAQPTCCPGRATGERIAND